MINKRFKKIGKLSKPYYTQHNEQTIDNRKGKIRTKIEKDIGGDEPYDLYRMISDQADRIDVLESIIKRLDPDCTLEPRLDVGDTTDVYNKVNSRMIEINDIVKEV